MEQVKPATDNCPKCSAVISDMWRYCPTCTADLGAPNCRECSSENEARALTRRADAVRQAAAKRGDREALAAFEQAIKEGSSVVITIPALFARQMCDNPSTIFVNYDKLVADGHRKPASPQNDRQRATVGAALFGTNATKIVYGALSLSGAGLPGYGEVFCRLRSVAIADRVSFLETNSYAFVRHVGATEVTPGHRSVWGNRHELAVAKLGSQITASQSADQWQQLLVSSDGITRNNDEFIEAHIWDSFDLFAIEEMRPVDGKALSRQERLDMQLALAAFSRNRTIGHG